MEVLFSEIDLSFIKKYLRNYIKEIVYGKKI